MGFSIHGHRRDVDAEKHLKRMHKTCALIESPLQGADHEKLVFSQRHEANTVELFFDLFFVANLATFTTYHSVTSYDYLVAYIGFFGILWSSWFQVTLHDVRFARDSIYERVCKTIQFIVFVGLALVGSGFNPADHTSNNTNFRILCYTLVLSRALLAVQYMVVLFYTLSAKYSDLYLPLGLMVAVYTIGAGAFGAMTPAFRAEEQTHRSVYIVWYIVMVIEAVVVILISSYWRMLSFKKTHLMERMSLLTIIVIGEGAIGVTKTVSRLMGKSGLEVEGCFLIMCIIVVLVLIWAIYFDNFPHGHYGTIRQQIWSVLHFPFQLAIVGVVEGSQQVALARYVIRNYVYIGDSIVKYCYEEHLDGEKLRDKLLDLVAYWDFEKKIETYGYTARTATHIYAVGNSTGICSVANATRYAEEKEWPKDFYEMMIEMYDGVYRGLGMKMNAKKLDTYGASTIAVNSWKVVYLYYWASFCLLVICSIAFMFLIRRHRADLFDFVSVIVRFVALGVGGIMIALVANQNALYAFIGSPGVLPTCVSLLFLISVFDKLSAAFCNWKLKKSGKPYAMEVDDHHHEAHSVPHLHIEHSETADENRKSKAWSTYSDSRPLTSASTEYLGGHEGYSLAPLTSPPIASIESPALSPPATFAHGHGGYAPIQQNRDEGA